MSKMPPKYRFRSQTILATAIALYLLYTFVRSDENTSSQSLTDAVTQCDLGKEEGCLRAGLIAFERRDQKASAAYFAEACRFNMNGDCWKLIDYDSFNKLRCDRGFEKGCVALSETYFDKRDYGNAIKYLDIACRLGNLDSCWELGSSYDIARPGLDQLCDKFPNNLSYCSENNIGRHLRKNRKRAAEYYDLACLGGGSVDTCYILFQWYNAGDGVPKSSKHANEYLELACRGFEFAECE